MVWGNQAIVKKSAAMGLTLFGCPGGLFAVCVVADFPCFNIDHFAHARLLRLGLSAGSTWPDGVG